MSKTIDVSIIIPVHEFNDETYKLFGTALQSIMVQKVLPTEVLIVAPKGSDAMTKLNATDYGTISDIVSLVENEGATDFASQVNLGVSVAKNEWVSFLEYDDEYASIWFKNVLEYQQAYPQVGIFMPIVVDVDQESNFVGFTNEAVWANSFSDELGILDLNALLTYQNFSIDGIVIKKSIFEEGGGIKSNIKLTFPYEFMLRMAFKDVRIMAIPKFGYKHVNQRPGSLFANYKKELDPIEVNWWLSKAKKEYYFDRDRKITYEENKA
jgi:GT2 family glycosyltransferase